MSAHESARERPCPQHIVVEQSDGARFVLLDVDALRRAIEQGPPPAVER